MLKIGANSSKFKKNGIKCKSSLTVLECTLYSVHTGINKYPNHIKFVCIYSFVNIQILYF